MASLGRHLDQVFSTFAHGGIPTLQEEMCIRDSLDGMSHRIVEIKQSPGSGYAAAGRAEIFASHRIRPSH